MFIGNLTPIQQSVFLTLAKELIASDGVLAPEEESLLNVFKVQVEYGVKETDYNINDLDKIFNTKKSKISTLLELIGLGYADNDFDENEKNYILKIAEALCVSKREVDECELWVTQQLSLVEKANELIGG